MQFRIFEINETEKFQFLMIQKNGATSVCQCILEKFPNQSWASTGPVKNKPRFAIIRDPYERFISGLKYDLKRNKVDIKDVKLEQLFTTNEIHIRDQLMQNIKHSVSQIPYLMSSGVSHYIDIKDLNLFLKMHFNIVRHLNKATVETKEIEEHLDKKEIMKYLHLDYYVYNSIKHSPFLWEWQHGRIF